MATRRNNASADASAPLTAPVDAAEFLGGETTQANLPRYAINDKNGDNGKTKALIFIQCTYEGTVQEVVEDKMRLSHRVKPLFALDTEREPAELEERIMLWGNYHLDTALPTLPEGTKVQITFKGKSNIGGGRTLKDIEVLYSSKVKLVPNRYLKHVTADGAGGGEAPF